MNDENKIIKKMNDALIVPKELLEKVGIVKNDYVKFVLNEDSSITLVKTNIQNKAILTLRKRNILGIPNELFKQHKLQYKSFDVLLDKSKTNFIIKLILNKNGNGKFKYRKDNEVSLKQIEQFLNIKIKESSKFELFIDEFSIIYLTFSLDDIKEIEENNISTEYTIKTLPLKEEMKNAPIKKVIEEQNKLNKDTLVTPEIIEDLYKKDIEIKDISPELLNLFARTKDTRVGKINKRNVVSIPKDIFNKLDLSNKVYTPVCNKDSKHLYVSLVYVTDTNSIKENIIYRHYRNENQLTITEATKEYLEKSIPIGTLYQLMYNEETKDLMFVFDNEAIKNPDYIPIVELTSKQKLVNKKEDIISVKEKQLQHEIEKRIARGDSIKFISEENLPKNETKCCICKKELTKQDKSMYKNHRVCNQCNRNNLKKFFNPIIELAKLKEKKGNK